MSARVVNAIPHWFLVCLHASRALLTGNNGFRCGGREDVPVVGGVTEEEVWTRLIINEIKLFRLLHLLQAQPMHANSRSLPNAYSIASGSNAGSIE